MLRGVGVGAHWRRWIGGLGCGRWRRRLGHRRVLRLHGRRVRGAGGLRGVSHGGLLGADDGLRGEGDGRGRARILEAAARRRRPRGCGVRGWRGGVGKLLRGRRILDVSGLGVGNALGGGSGGLPVPWPLLWRQIGPVPHGDGLVCGCRIELTGLSDFVLRGIRCAVMLMLWPMAARSCSLTTASRRLGPRAPRSVVWTQRHGAGVVNGKIGVIAAHVVGGRRLQVYPLAGRRRPSLWE